MTSHLLRPLTHRLYGEMSTVVLMLFCGRRRFLCHAQQVPDDPDY